ADDIARQVLDRPQQTTVEGVDRPAAPHLGQARGLQLLELEALAQQVLGQGVPALRGVTALEGVDVLLGEAPVEEELAGRLRLRGLQLLTVELVGRLVRVDEAFAGARFFTTRPRRPTLVV